MSTRTILGTAALMGLAALPATGTAQGLYPTCGYAPYASNYGAFYPTQYVRGGRPLRVGGATVFFGPGGGYFGQAAYGYDAPTYYGYGALNPYGGYGYRRVARRYWGW